MLNPHAGTSPLYFGSTARTTVMAALKKAKRKLKQGEKPTGQEMTLLAANKQGRLDMLIRSAEQNASPPPGDTFVKATPAEAPSGEGSMIKFGPVVPIVLYDPAEAPSDPGSPMLVNKPDLVNMTDPQAIEYNRTAGKAHAEHLAKTIPVMAVDPINPMQPGTVQIRVTKVALPDKSTGLSITANGVPWKFQPQPDDHVSNFLIAHDISRHLVLNRNRTSNWTNPSAEYNTGQVTSNISAAPADIAHYDGILANIADKRTEHEHGDTSFSILQDIIYSLGSSGYPAGTFVDISYVLPPPDVVYEESPTETPIDEKHHRVYMLQDGGHVNKSGKIPKYKYQEVYQQISQNPSFTKTETPPKEGYTNRTETYDCPFKDHPEYRLVYHFNLKDQKISEARKYCRKPDGKLVLLAEGALLKAGHQPVKDDGYSRIYVIKQDHRFLKYKFEGKETSHSAVQSIYEHQTNGLRPVYTGYPYEPIRIEDVQVHVPVNTREISDDQIPKTADPVKFREESRRKNQEEAVDRKNEMEAKVQKYKNAFGTYQQKLEELLSEGTLPMNMDMTTSWSFGSFLERHPFLMDKPEVKAVFPNGLPKTVPAIQQAIALAEKAKELQDNPEMSEILNKGDGTVAPFPPPPFKLPSNIPVRPQEVPC